MFLAPHSDPTELSPETVAKFDGVITLICDKPGRVLGSREAT